MIALNSRSPRPKLDTAVLGPIIGLSAYVSRTWVDGLACEYLERTRRLDFALGCRTPVRGGAGGAWDGSWIECAGAVREAAPDKVTAGSEGFGGGVRWRGFRPPKLRSSRRMVWRGVSLKVSLGAGSD